MIKSKLIKKDKKYCRFILEDNKEILTLSISSFIVGETYTFQTTDVGYSLVYDRHGKGYNVLILE